MTATTTSRACLQDACGRRVRYLRLSVTPACPMRCLYCRPVSTLPLRYGTSEACLSPTEIQQLVETLVAVGLRKVRVTGGEPTARADLLDIVRRLASVRGLDDLAMTTNGLTLARQARALAVAGLRRVNVSLDSLDAGRFRRITGIDALPRVLEGIDAAIASGLTPLKLNCVVVRGENDHECPELLQFAADKQVELRFIELMPMGPLANCWRERFVSSAETRSRLDPLVARWSPRDQGSAPTRSFDVLLRDGRSTRVGFISAMSCPFCDRCDRVRIAADGSFFGCLMDRPTISLLPALRPFDPEALFERIERALERKPRQHAQRGHSEMVSIGG